MSSPEYMDSRCKTRLSRIESGKCACGAPLSERVNEFTGKPIRSCDRCYDKRLAAEKKLTEKRKRLRAQADARAALVARVFKPKPQKSERQLLEEAIRLQIWREVKDEWENCRTNGEFTKWVAARAKGVAPKTREVMEETI